LIVCISNIYSHFVLLNCESVCL